MNYTAKATILVNAPVSKVWDALINPKIIKQYLFGTTVESDWKAGSAITYTGTWEGKAYKDKGRVIEIIPNKLLKTTFWSSLSKLPDTPENYNNVAYSLDGDNGKIRVTITQDNNSSQESADHSAKNWKMVLEKMKEILEG